MVTSVNARPRRTIQLDAELPEALKARQARRQLACGHQDTHITAICTRPHEANPAEAYDEALECLHCGAVWFDPESARAAGALKGNDEARAAVLSGHPRRMDPNEVLAEDLPEELPGIDAALEYLSAHLSEDDPLLRQAHARRDRIMVGMLQGAGYRL